MKTREIALFLKANGYAIIRHGKKHDFWGKGEHVVTMSQGSKMSDMTARSVMSAVRKYAAGALPLKQSLGQCLAKERAT